MAEGFRIASAYVTVDPDLEGFKEKLQAELDEAVAGVEAKVPVGLNQEQLDADIEDVKGKVDDLKSQQANPKVGLDKEELDAGVDESKAKVDELDGKTARPRADLEDSDLKGKADADKAALDDLGAKKAKATADLDDEAAKAKINSLRAQIASLKYQGTGIPLDADSSPAQVKIAELVAELSALEAKEAKARVGLDDSEFKQKLAEDEGEFSAFGALTEHPVIAGLTGGISALLPGIGAGVAGLGLLAGTGALAFTGVSRALSAHSQASQNVGITGAQMAQTAFQNAVAVQQAQFAITQAQQEAAQNAQAAAAQVESAQMQQQETVRNAASAQVQALQGVTEAEQQQQQANFALSQAQYNLSAAWIDARYHLEQLRDAEQDNATTIRAARLAVAQAEYQQKLTDQDAFSTALDRQQASIAVAQAQEQLTAAYQTAKYNSAEYNLQEKHGVAGSQEVVQAREAVKVATEGVRDAVFQLSDAERNLTNTEKNNADQIKAAMLAVREAERQQAFQNKQDAEQIAQAQQNLTNTITEQRLAWAATLSTSNSAANQFALDMSRLSAPARNLVNELLRMHGAIRILEDTAQRTIAPGLDVFFHGLLRIMPIINRGVAEMGHAMSAAFGSFGRLMGTSAFREGLAGLLRNGVQFANIVLPAFARFLQMMGRIGGEKGAALGLANLLAGLANGLTGLVIAVTPAIPSIDKLFSVIGQALTAIGPLLGSVVAAIAQGLAPAIAALLPGFRDLVSQLGPSLVLAIHAMAPALLLAGKAISDMAIATAPLLPLMARFIAEMVTDLVPILVQLMPEFNQWAQLMPPILQGLTPLVKPLADLTLLLTTGISPGLAMVIGWIVKFQDANERLLANVAHVVENWKADWNGFKTWAVSLWTGFKDWFVNLWTSMTSWVSNHITDFLSWAKSAMHTGVQDLSKIWHAIEPALKVPVNFLIGTVYDNGIRRLWDDIVGAVGLNSLKLPVVPQMARGGIMPGKDTGKDQYLVKVRGGEGFLTPETVQGIGPGTVHGLNNMFSRGGGHSGGGHVGKDAGKELRRHGMRLPEHLLGFKDGGILNWIDRGITDIGKIILGGAGFVSGLIANPIGTITHLLDRVVATPAKGGLGQVLTAMPHKLIGDLAKAFAADSPANGLSMGTRGNLSGSPLGNAMVHYAESFAGKVPYVWGGTSPLGWDCSGFTDYVMHHFGFNSPRTSEAQWAWVQRTPKPVLGGLAFFTGSPIDPPPGHVGIVTGSDQMVDAYGTGFGTRYNAIYGSSGTVWGFGVPPGSGMASKGGGKIGSSFDGGGYLMPAGSGGGPGWNFTGQPEAVLDPRQTQLLERLIQTLEQRGALQPAVNFNYFGPQRPTAEMQAQQMRDLAMTLGGG